MQQGFIESMHGYNNAANRLGISSQMGIYEFCGFKVQHIHTDPHPILRFEEIMSKVSGSKNNFTKRDLREAYQIDPLVHGNCQTCYVFNTSSYLSGFA